VSLSDLVIHAGSVLALIVLIVFTERLLRFVWLIFFCTPCNQRGCQHEATSTGPKCKDRCLYFGCKFRDPKTNQQTEG